MKRISYLSNILVGAILIAIILAVLLLASGFFSNQQSAGSGQAKTYFLETKNAPASSTKGF